MHMTKGLVENAIHMIFNLPTGKVRRSRDKKVPCEGINGAMVTAKAPVELSRRPRAIDESTIKTEELRNWVLIYFPLFAEAIADESPTRPDLEIWLLLAFLLRAYNIPGEEAPIPGRIMW
jgi:hypothetical protein